jgi:hypothetical protein
MDALGGRHVEEGIGERPTEAHAVPVEVHTHGVPDTTGEFAQDRSARLDPEDAEASRECGLPNRHSDAQHGPVLRFHPALAHHGQPHARTVPRCRDVQGLSHGDGLDEPDVGMPSVEGGGGFDDSGARLGVPVQHTLAIRSEMDHPVLTRMLLGACPTAIAGLHESHA